MAINEAGTAQPSDSTSGASFGGILADVGKAVQAGISAQALAQAQQASQGLKDAAASGQLRIEEGGFDALMNAVNVGYTELENLRTSVYIVSQAPQLGTSPYAQTVSAHVQKGGTGQAQSADVVVDQLSVLLDNIRDALNIAKKNYDDNEHGNAQALK